MTYSVLKDLLITLVQSLNQNLTFLLIAANDLSKVVFPIKVTEYDVFGVKGFTDYFGTKFESESYIFTNSDRELFKKHVVVKEKPLLPKEDEAKEIYDLLNMLDNLGTCHLFGKRARKAKDVLNLLRSRRNYLIREAERNLKNSEKQAEIHKSTLAKLKAL
nr:unknown function [Klebsiella phage vB_Ko_K41P2]